MHNKRVVVTGLGAISPFGVGCDALYEGLISEKCAIKRLENNPMVDAGFKCGALVPDVDYKQIPRQTRRAMSNMSIYACLSAKEALQQAGLWESPLIEEASVSAASTLGSPFALEEFFGEYVKNNSVDSVKSTVFFKVMSHTLASSIAAYCGIVGGLFAPSAACASGLIALALAYDRILLGKEDIVIVSAADEFHPLTCATFDMLGAASHQEDPLLSSRPFHKDRDGVVIGEGAGVIILENYDSAIKRNAPILAEIKGYSTYNSPKSIAAPDIDIMLKCMKRCLINADCTIDDVQYINAHATGTALGDISEGLAIKSLCQDKQIPVSSYKGYIGHTLAASGILESIVTILAMKNNTLIPNYMLSKESIASELEGLNLLEKRTTTNAECFLKNSFALGGVYCSMLFKK